MRRLAGEELSGPGEYDSDDFEEDEDPYDRWTLEEAMMDDEEIKNHTLAQR